MGDMWNQVVSKILQHWRGALICGVVWNILDLICLFCGCLKKHWANVIWVSQLMSSRGFMVTISEDGALGGGRIKHWYSATDDSNKIDPIILVISWVGQRCWLRRYPIIVSLPSHKLYVFLTAAARVLCDGELLGWISLDRFWSGRGLEVRKGN